MKSGDSKRGVGVKGEGEIDRCKEEKENMEGIR
jgi:hypothetical protein